MTHATLGIDKDFIHLEYLQMTRLTMQRAMHSEIVDMFKLADIHVMTKR